MNIALKTPSISKQNTSEQFHENLVLEAKRYAYSFTKDWHDAEDLVQQAWLRLKKKYLEVTSRALLFRAIRNLYIDGSRRKKIVRFEPIENAYDLGSTDSFGTESDLEEILNYLPPSERESLSLHIVEGYSVSEISAKIGKPRGTVLSHIYRVRQKLVEQFGHEFRGSHSSSALRKAG